MYLDKETIRLELLNQRELDPVTGCWRFSGCVLSNGYGMIRVDGHEQPFRVHRLAAFVYLDLDITNPSEQANHKLECKYKDCFNPDHLYVGNQSQNIQDTVTKGTHNNSRKTHCKRGHELDGYNLIIHPGGNRQCRTCYNKRNKESRERKRLMEMSYVSR